ncbi:E3 ubiquitin-protein ligase NHLRC1-like [Notolabrus celidotus]|uniref:E3 ubiquitin-protein ligase NHLRC1-like n=1 Tax=Notolabrus celidotus TaxID=1203425 RepID=UPI0014903A90|nr:E3 ubiquitin-protein ligase NHLRC1-like [Notolabrus celidotus]
MAKSLRGPKGALREIQINLLECKVCFEKFNTQQRERRPQNLSCGHVLCLECIAALSHPLLRKLECPFCRQLCSVDSTSPCQVLTDLQEMLFYVSPTSSKEGFCPATGLTSTALHLCTAFGGWGTLFNPTGIAVLGASGTVVVVHDGEERVVVFSPQGRKLHSFGPRGRAAEEICYPVDVAATPCGYVVVTDAGDQAVKVFTSRGKHVLTIKELFLMPWGVDSDSHGDILVTDPQTGILSQVKVDYNRGVILKCEPVVSDLQHPKTVACCQVTGNAAVLEHLPDEKYPPSTHQHWRLKVFSTDFHLIYQADSFSLALQSTVRLNISGVAFDGDRGVIVIDSNQGMIWSLGNVQKGPHLSPLVGDHLIRPTGLVLLKNTLVILDSGDHTVKICSARSDAWPIK